VQQNGGHTFLQCISGGVLDPIKYMLYRQNEFERLDSIRKRGWGGEYTEVSFVFSSFLPRSVSFLPVQIREPKRRAQYPKTNPKESEWWKFYVASTRCNRCWKNARLFRRRFGLPWVRWRVLCERAKDENWFPMSGRCDAIGREGAPLELLILGALRYLRRGWTFDDLAECTGITLL